MVRYHGHPVPLDEPVAVSAHHDLVAGTGDHRSSRHCGWRDDSRECRYRTSLGGRSRAIRWLRCCQPASARRRFSRHAFLQNSDKGDSFIHVMIVEPPPRVQAAGPGFRSGGADRGGAARGRMRRRRRVAAVGIAVAVASLGYGWWGDSGSHRAAASRAERPRVVSTIARGVGGFVAFGARSTRTGVTQVYLLHPGGAVTQLTHGPRASDVQSWSPDGSHLVIDQVAAIRPSGCSSSARVAAPSSHWPAHAGSSPGEQWAGNAAWWPDGSHIAFDRQTIPNVGHGRPSSGVVIDSSNGRRVTKRVWLPAQHLGDPSGSFSTTPWSPDGSHLVLLDNTGNVHTVRADGTDDVGFDSHRSLDVSCAVG